MWAGWWVWGRTCVVVLPPSRCRGGPAFVGVWGLLAGKRRQAGKQHYVLKHALHHAPASITCELHSTNADVFRREPCIACRYGHVFAYHAVSGGIVYALYNAIQPEVPSGLASHPVRQLLDHYLDPTFNVQFLDFLFLPGTSIPPTPVAVKFLPRLFELYAKQGAGGAHIRSACRLLAQLVVVNQCLCADGTCILPCSSRAVVTAP